MILCCIIQNCEYKIWREPRQKNKAMIIEVAIRAKCRRAYVFALL